VLIRQFAGARPPIEEGGAPNESAGQDRSIVEAGRCDNALAAKLEV
jgi:hypothetical protein